MTELRNTEHELARFRLRLLAAALFVLFAFGLLAARLAYLQIGKHDELSTQAENNRIAVVPITPNRGLILDRNGIVLANNYSAYTLEIAPAKVRDLDATIDRLAEVVTIEARDRRRFKRQLEESKSLESLPIRTKLSDEEVARFTAQRFRFPGVEIKARLFRSYPLGEVGSHLIGYIGRINPTEKKAMEDDWPEDRLANYRGTEYIGKLGVEQSYESQLHGTTGFEEVEMSAGGHAVRRLRSSPATPGNALVLSIDIRLQAMVEELFGDRRGALVAIDPRNGEILAFVSKPNFDPNLFVDGIDVENWKALNESPDKPLLNRALRGTYPPGSTYKPFMAMAALTLGKRTPQQAISDPGYYNFGNHRFRDDKEGGHGTVDMYKSIVQSCDTYYYIARQRPGRRRDARLHGAARLRPAHRHRPAGRAARHAAVDRVEAQRLPQEGSAEVVRRRDDLARHRPGLQHLHHAAAGAGDGDDGGGRPAPPAAPGARGRALREPHARAARVQGSRRRCPGSRSMSR